MKHLTAAAVFVFALIMQTSAFAEEWSVYESSDYGFSMLVPSGTKLETKEFGGGWGGLRGASEGVNLVAVAKLGPAEPAADIEAFGVQVTGIPKSNWELIDGGSGHGWDWHKTVIARQGNEVYFGGYGVGSRGSYLILLKTTQADFISYRADYDDWYDSVRLF
ncbi:MAG: hypothetical protein AB7E72_07490 [Lysobacterales bacterium]